MAAMVSIRWQLFGQNFTTVGTEWALTFRNGLQTEWYFPRTNLTQLETDALRWHFGYQQYGGGGEHKMADFGAKFHYCGYWMGHNFLKWPSNWMIFSRKLPNSTNNRFPSMTFGVPPIWRPWWAKDGGFPAKFHICAYRMGPNWLEWPSNWMIWCMH